MLTGFRDLIDHLRGLFITLRFYHTIPRKRETRTMSPVLERELATLAREAEHLEREHRGKFVLIRGDEIIDTFDTFDAAAEEGLRRFGQGPYLIRQIGAESMSLPPALAYGFDLCRSLGSTSRILSGLSFARSSFCYSTDRAFPLRLGWQPQHINLGLNRPFLRLHKLSSILARPTAA
jgi:hypothetical protein